MKKQTLPRAISEDAHSFIEICRQTVKSSLISIILFGSATKGKLSDKSDLDFLIIIKKYDETVCKKLWKILTKKSAAALKRKVDLLFAEESALYDLTSAFAMEVQASGKTLYGKDFLTGDFMKKFNIKPVMAGGRQVAWRVSA